MLHSSICFSQALIAERADAINRTSFVDCMSTENTTIEHSVDLQRDVLGGTKPNKKGSGFKRYFTAPTFSRD
jgi:hypothetical protein